MEDNYDSHDTLTNAIRSAVYFSERSGDEGYWLEKQAVCRDETVLLTRSQISEFESSLSFKKSEERQRMINELAQSLESS